MTRSFRRMALFTAAGAVLLGIMATRAEDAGPLAHFGWFADMAGACWTGRLPDGKTTDTQCYSIQYGRLLRGTIRLQKTHGGQAVSSFEGDSVYAWDAKVGKIRYSFWANDGSYGTAEAYLDGDTIVFPVSDPNDSSRVIARSVWRRIDADTFTVTRERLTDGAWQEQLKVTYSREMGSEFNSDPTTGAG
jgi:hypothetical protein